MGQLCGPDDVLSLVDWPIEIRGCHNLTDYGVKPTAEYDLGTIFIAEHNLGVQRHDRLWCMDIWWD